MFRRCSRFVLHSLIVPAAALLMTSLCPACEVEAVVPKEELQAKLSSALDILWRGQPDSKRAAVEEVDDWARYFSTAGPEDDDAREAVEWLRTIVHMEKDDWISSRLLQNLSEHSCELLNPLYRDALSDPSPNVRWRAIQWFRSQTDLESVELLENLWSSEERPWVRADLMEALAWNNSSRFVKEWLRLARGEDTALGIAAIHALKALENEEFIPDLAAISRGKSQALRSAAIQVLASWPDSQDALDAVLSATHSGDRSTQLSAVASLASLPSEEGVQRLMELARAGPDTAMRFSALEALEKLSPPEFADLLVDILREPASEASSSLQSEAIWALHEMDDPDVLPKLSGLNPDLGGGGFANLRDLVDNLARDRSVSPLGDARIRVVCGILAAGDDGTDEGNHAFVAPTVGLQTIRCWEFPLVPGDPEDFIRIPSGSEVWIEDHFEFGADSWVQVSGEDADECWVPRDQLQSAAENSLRPAPPADPYRIELDVMLEELQGDGAQTLKGAGLLESFQSGDQVVGVSLTLHPDEVASLPALVSGYRDDGSLLDDAVAALLRTLLEALPARSELMEFFRVHPDAKEEDLDAFRDGPGTDEDAALLIDP